MAFPWLFTQFMTWLSASAILLFSVIAAFLSKVVRTWKRSKLLEKYFDGPPKHWLYGSIEHVRWKEPENVLADFNCRHERYVWNH
eukprot:m.151280 g.151280  ORF g.151280 m.151280 type:complete len:85 (+) comp38581_c0_seq16:105-359(+)